MSVNKEGNFVKIDRKMISWGWYTDVSTKCLFLHCILRANWKPGEWKGIRYERGQFITSLSNLSHETGLSVKQVRTALKHLKETNEVASYSTSKLTVITVTNYDKYQTVGKVEGKQGANQGQSEGKQGANKGQQYKKEKNNKEGKKEKNTAAPQSCPSGIDLNYDPEPGVDPNWDYYKQRGGY